jgi:Tfp pilus assembly ATPase PilU
MNVKPLFKLMVDKNASDLFFTTYSPVMIKIDGKIMPVNQVELSPKMVRQAALELMNEQQLENFTRDLEIDFAISEAGLGRFRVNVFHQRGNVAMVLRFITPELPQLDALGMPDILKDMIMLRRGLILMVGASGSGKSTTLAVEKTALAPGRHSNFRRIQHGHCREMHSSRLFRFVEAPSQRHRGYASIAECRLRLVRLNSQK